MSRIEEDNWWYPVAAPGTILTYTSDGTYTYKSMKRPAIKKKVKKKVVKSKAKLIMRDVYVITMDVDANSPYHGAPFHPVKYNQCCTIFESRKSVEEEVKTYRAPYKIVKAKLIYTIDTEEVDISPAKKKKS